MQKFSIFLTIITTIFLILYLLIINNIVVLFDSLENYVVFRMIAQTCLIAFSTISVSLILMSILKENDKLNKKILLVCLVMSLIIVISQVISIYTFSDEVYYNFTENKEYIRLYSLGWGV